jgi:hypothetical protein
MVFSVCLCVIRPPFDGLLIVPALLMDDQAQNRQAALV